MKKIRTAGGEATVHVAPMLVALDLDDDCEEHKVNEVERPCPCPSSVQMLGLGLVKPVAVRVGLVVKPGLVVRPIPNRVTAMGEDFYKATEQAQLPFDTVHKAVMQSRQWQQKWSSTMQEADPAGHDCVVDCMGEDDLILAQYMADRNGAKNPSPRNNNNDDHDDLERKRLRHQRSLEISSPQVVPPETPVMVIQRPIVQRPIVQRPIVQRPIVQRPIVQRPIAMRVTAAAVQQTQQQPQPQQQCWIPRDIMDDDSSRSLSPMTCATSLDSQMSSQFRPQQSEQVREDAAAPAIIEDDYCSTSGARRVPLQIRTTAAVQQAREGILHALAISGGETDSPQFQSSLQVLQEHFNSSQQQYSSNNKDLLSEGMWLTLTNPTFFGCAGKNDNGDPMYTLGRMSFDMYSPSDMICSLQGNFNSVEQVVDKTGFSVPKSLAAEVGSDATVLRTYNIITAFTIEPHLAAYPKAPNKDVTRPIRGIMTTYGYMIADPSEDATDKNRQSLWITGGKIEPNDCAADVAAWQKQFAAHPPKHGMGALARLLAVKLLMGAVLPDGMDPETGAMEFSFTRPLGGHGMAFIDTLYCDDSLRIVKGHRGTVFVFSKMPDQKK